MRANPLLPALILPLTLALVSCESKGTTEQELSSGADKIAEGVQEMSDAAAAAAEEAHNHVKEAAETKDNDAESVRDFRKQHQSPESK